MNKFEKVSLEEYEKSLASLDGLPLPKEEIIAEYESIKLPKRATKYSAGYDFFAPFKFVLPAGESIKIPTGIRVCLDNDKFLACYPRSGLGFKYRLQLDNSVGIIDADYYYSDNEGHIFAKITNDNREGKSLIIKCGEAFMQGIITKYFKTDDDVSETTRNGGFGSTDTSSNCEQLSSFD